MPKIAYIKQKFGSASRALIEKANAVLADYEAQGYKLTLRGLYYKLVKRNYIPNTMKSYKRLGSIINDARMAGLIDWEMIEDLTREVVTPPHWGGPADIIDAVARQFRIDKWADQPYRPEVWIEKAALTSIVKGICEELDISFLACRGYTSQSEMWSSAMRLKKFAEDHNQEPIILHFGDHDPSGIDMTRDITDRLETFMGGITLKRLALNMDQIEEYQPPPNPAKVTDSRFTGYQNKFGDESWELDALEPAVIVGLIRKAALSLRDEEKWAAKVEEERRHRSTLKWAADNWGDGTPSYTENLTVSEFIKNQRSKRGE